MWVPILPAAIMQIGIVILFLTMMKNGKKYRSAVSCLEDSKIFESHPGSKRSAYQHTDQHHDLLPVRLLLVLKSLLGVIGGPGCVFHGTLHVRINPVHHLPLVLNQDGDVHEHLVQLLDRLLQLDEHLVSLLDVVDGSPQLVFVSLDLDVPCQACTSTTLQHLFELLIRGSLARDLQLTSNLLLALLSVINLDPIVLGHHLDEPPRRRHLLRPSSICSS